MTLREVRGNVASRELTLGILALLELAEALRGRSEESLCVASHVGHWAAGSSGVVRRHWTVRTR